MHHHKLATGSKLSREADQRKALLKSMATSLVLREKITTTKPKAKTVQPYVERLITKAKQGGLHQRRQVAAAISTEEALVKLFNDLGPRFAKRAGGYTRIAAAGYRRGDNAQMATISFTEQPAKQEKATTSKKPAKAEPKPEAKSKVAARETAGAK